MKHFSEASWADFARNVVATVTRMTMQQHIDEGCRKCAVTLRVWQGIFAIAENERILTPPTDIVRVVKSQFAAVAGEVKSGFRLLFDSSLQPMAAGFRGSMTARQLLYETDEFYIDLRVEPRHELDRAGVVGQVMRRTGAQREAQGVAVRIQAGKLPVAQTSTNQFGEFQVEIDPADNLCVVIEQHEADEVVLPLYGIQAKPLGPQDLD